MLTEPVPRPPRPDQADHSPPRTDRRLAKTGATLD